jgi:putative nucleotidyltransferase with HDIG domain
MKKLKEEMEVTKHLLMISEATAHTIDINQLMERVVHCCQMILDSDICLSYLWDRITQVFRPCQAFGLSRENISLFVTEQLDANLEFIKKTIEKRETVIERFDYRLKRNGSQQPLIADKQLLTTGFFTWIPNINIIVSIPLIGREEIIGFVIGVYRYKEVSQYTPKEFTENDRKIMEGISHQVSIALEEARLYRESIERAMELSRKIETIHIMHEIDRGILSTLEGSEILEIAIRMISKVINCDRAIVAIVDRERQGFVAMAGFGSTIIPKSGFVPFEDTNTTDIVKTGRLQYTADLREVKRPLILEKRLIEEGFLSHMRVPLKIKDDIVGVLNVGSKRISAFTTEDLSTMEKIAAQIGVALQNARLLTELEELFLNTIKSLSAAIDAKSSWTKGHSDRVMKIVLDIAHEMGFSEKELRDLKIVGLLHDIGKLGTYEAILDKPGKLTDEEFKMIKQHPVKGAEILRPIKQLKSMIPAVKHHHEAFNGRGYPDGLKGDEISLMARILSIADTVDAMHSDRPYRKGKSINDIVLKLKRCSDTQFDPKVVGAYLISIDKKTDLLQSLTIN